MSALAHSRIIVFLLLLLCIINNIKAITIHFDVFNDMLLLVTHAVAIVIFETRGRRFFVDSVLALSLSLSAQECVDFEFSANVQYNTNR